MDERQLSDLRSLDWEHIAAKVLRAAPILAARYGWNLDSILPNGNSLEGLVAEAIAEIWEEPERINPEVSLTTQLKGIVRQKLWNLSQRREEKTKGLASVEHTVDERGGDRQLIKSKSLLSDAIDLLLSHPKVKGNEELELVVMALSCGALSAEEIETETKMARARIYQLTRELRDIYPDIAKRLLAEGRSA